MQLCRKRCARAQRRRGNAAQSSPTLLSVLFAGQELNKVIGLQDNYSSVQTELVTFLEGFLALEEFKGPSGSSSAPREADSWATRLRC